MDKTALVMALCLAYMWTKKEEKKKILFHYEIGRVKCYTLLLLQEENATQLFYLFLVRILALQQYFISRVSHNIPLFPDIKGTR